MVQETGGTGEPCAELKGEIEQAQREFEQLWITISTGGGGDRMRYRELREQLTEMRTRYGRECGELREDSSLPRSVTADWRAG